METSGVSSQLGDAGGCRSSFDNHGVSGESSDGENFWFSCSESAAMPAIGADETCAPDSGAQR